MEFKKIEREAVQQVLRVLNKHQGLGDSPLIHAAFVGRELKEKGLKDNLDNRIFVLRLLLIRAIDTLQIVEPQNELFDKTRKKPRSYLILKKRFVDEISQAKIALELNLALSTVKNEQSQAIDYLTTTLNIWENDSLSVDRIFLTRMPLYKPIIGQENLQLQVIDNLTSGQSLSLTGLPGVGKTSLLISIAHDTRVHHHFHDGILWSNLGQNADILSLIDNWARCLGIWSDNFRLASTDEKINLIRIVVEKRKLLFLLDDLWYLKNILPLLFKNTTSAYVITTRFPEVAQSLPGFNILRVKELGVEESLLVLKKLAPEIFAQHYLQAEALSLATGGLPIALNIMGNYLRKQSYSQQSRRINRAFEKINKSMLSITVDNSVGFDNIKTKKISLGSIISISDSALDIKTKKILRALSLLSPKPNSFSEDAAISITGATAHAIDQLIDFGLLESVGYDRYTIHPLIAEYGKEHLLNQLSIRTTEHRIVNYFIEYLNKNQKNYLAIEQEMQNIYHALRLALKNDDGDDYIQLANFFNHYLESQGFYLTAEENLNTAIKLSKNLSHLVIAYKNLGGINNRQGKYTDAKSNLNKALEIAKELNDKKMVAATLTQIGVLAAHSGEFLEAYNAWDEAIIVAHALDDNFMLSGLMMAYSTVSIRKGDMEQAKKYAISGLIYAKKSGDQGRVAGLLINLGSALTEQGFFDEGIPYFFQALEKCKEHGLKDYMSLVLNNLGTCYEKQKQFDAAKQYYLDAIIIARDIGHNERLSQLLRNLAWVCCRLGDLVNAIEFSYQSLAIAQEINHPLRIADALIACGFIEMEQKEYQSAELSLRSGLEISEKIDSAYSIARCLWGLAKLSYYRDELLTAKMYGNKSLGLLNSLNHIDAFEVSKWLSENSLSDL